MKFFNLIELTYGQSNINNTNTNPLIINSLLPSHLIHGYMEDAAFWNKGVDLLKKVGISAVYPITFIL